jgi:hypothetical protein
VTAERGGVVDESTSVLRSAAVQGYAAVASCATSSVPASACGRG